MIAGSVGMSPLGAVFPRVIAGIMIASALGILGLRALYFALAAMVDRFHYLKYALAVLLIFIGSKIFVADLLGIGKIPPAISLGVTFAILATGVGWSLWKTRPGAAKGSLNSPSET
jgi:tellurite resistance protein TerC